MIWANRSLDLITIGSAIYCNAFFSQLVRTNVADLLLTYCYWKFLFGSFIPRCRLESEIAKYSIHTGAWLTDWHTLLKTLDSSALEPCQLTTHASKIIPQKAAIPGFQTEMATKRQNLWTAALRKFYNYKAIWKKERLMKVIFFFIYSSLFRGHYKKYLNLRFSGFHWAFDWITLK